MIKPGEIQQIANKLGVRDTQIEKDYIIGWILKGISNTKYLNERLAFKGGTALRKMYFHDYRLSEDMDFTNFGGSFSTEEIKSHFNELIAWLKDEARITLSIQDETVHQTGNYSYYLGYIGPLGGTGANKNIKVDIANDELLCNDPVEKNVYNEYSDLSEDFSVKCYSLGEIISEKMRSLIQRTMPRDIYDIWYLFEIENENIEDYIYDFRRKMEFKKLDPADLVNSVQNKMDRFKRQWNEHLINQIKDIPDFDDVWRRLSKHWKRFESSF